MVQYEKVHLHLRDIIVNNFFGGIAWALGATVGLSIVIFLLSIVFKHINVIPFVGDFISKITEEVLKNLQRSPQLLK